MIYRSLCVDDESNELLEWHLAYLRKNATLSGEVTDLTPRTLIKQDRDLLNQLAAKDLRRASASSRILNLDVQKQASSGLKIPSRMELFQLLMLAAAIFFAIFVPQSILLVLILCILLVLSALIALSGFGMKIRIPEAIWAVLKRFSGETSANPAADHSLSYSEANKLMLGMAKQIALMEQKERLIFEYSSLLLCRLSADGYIVDVNSHAEKIWGYKKVEVLGAQLAELVLEESFPSVLQECKTSKQFLDREFALEHKDGSTKYLALHVEWSEKSSCYFCSGEDVSLRRASERLNAEMSAILNHDIRAPIVSFQYATRNLMEGTYGELPEKARDNIGRISRSLSELIILMDNHLQAQQIDSDRLNVELRQFAVQECFDRVFGLLADSYLASRVELQVEKTELQVYGDFELSSRILLNLCSNALKWSPAGADVSITAVREGDLIQIQVKDKGPGIPDEIRAGLFDCWTAKRNQADPKNFSIGLGLFICRRFAEIQNGKIDCKSKAGQGSSFYLTLPISSSTSPLSAAQS